MTPKNICRCNSSTVASGQPDRWEIRFATFSHLGQKAENPPSRHRSFAAAEGRGRKCLMASDAQWKIRGRKSNSGVAVSSMNTIAIGQGCRLGDS